MNRFRFVLVALCTLTLASVASAATPSDTSSSAGVCTKLCAIGFHCVPTPNGGTCVPGNGLAEPAPADSTDSTELIAGGSYCNKLCIIGYHCVPNPNGGTCVPGGGLAEPAPADSTGSTEVAAGGSFCNKLCAIGFHCVPNPNGGVCVPGNGLAEPAPADSTEPTSPASSDCGADTGVGALVASNSASVCGACTILCPYPLHLVQKANCQCKCVGSAG